MAFDSNRAKFLVGECKWSNRKVGVNFLQDLVTKSKNVPELQNKEIIYMLFSKSGFTDAVKERAADNLILFDLREIGKAAARK